jgi:hypothetical protein
MKALFHRITERKQHDMIKIDMWYKDQYKFKKRKYGADAFFTPGNGYSGNIYNEEGKPIGDYHTDDSIEADEMFLIDWKE